MRLFLLVGIFAFSFAGCTIKQKVMYSFDDILPVNAWNKINAIVDIELFADNRATINDNSILFKVGRNYGGQCYNSEEHYPKDSVSTQLSRDIMTHLAKRNSFKNVLLNSKNDADYYVTGKINRFYGAQEFSTSAAAGAQFGLIGALTTMDSKTKGNIIIELSEITLCNKNGVIKRLDDIKETYSGELPADAYCWQIYMNVNQQLKKAIDKLCQSIESNAKVAVSGTAVQNTQPISISNQPNPKDSVSENKSR
jgi:hypothetical protein